MWIEIRDNQRKKHTINLNNVVDVIFHEESDCTEIVYLRSAIGPVWIKGNIMPELRRILVNDLHRIGE